MDVAVPDGAVYPRAANTVAPLPGGEGGAVGDVTARPRTDDDLPACVRALEAVHASDGYPTWWPADPAEWLSPSGYAAAWVAEDRAAGSIVGHVCVVRGVDDPLVASLTGVASDRLASVSRLFVSPAVRGRGHARALLGKTSSWTSAQDLQLMLDVVEDGGHAVELYERLGWRLVDRRQAGWVTPRGERLPVRIYLAPQDSPLSLRPGTASKL